MLKLKLVVKSDLLGVPHVTLSFVIYKQKNCGNCYSFAAAGALEGAYKIKYGLLYNLSVQQYTSCSKNYTTSTSTYTSCKGTNCTSWTQEKWYLSTSGNNVRSISRSFVSEDLNTLVLLFRAAAVVVSELAGLTTI